MKSFNGSTRIPAVLYVKEESEVESTTMPSTESLTTRTAVGWSSVFPDDDSVAVRVLKESAAGDTRIPVRTALAPAVIPAGIDTFTIPESGTRAPNVAKPVTVTPVVEELVILTGLMLTS